MSNTRINDHQMKDLLHLGYINIDGNPAIRKDSNDDGEGDFCAPV